jgi:hypothetical protein
MQGNQTFLDPPESTDTSGRATERKTMSFSFDKSYWSAGPRDEPQYCSQQTLYDDLGKELLEHGFAGFNTCILTCRLFKDFDFISGTQFRLLLSDGQTGATSINTLVPDCDVFV